jgi:myo-inositol-1(or 4)-monophosphatase
MDQFLTVAREAAHQAGALLRANWLQPKTIEVKTDIVDLVTNVDKAADALITGILHTHFPTHQIIAEESAVSGQESPYRWYIDPLDGTTNFAHTFPHFAVSIALAHESQMIVGVVYDPLRNETFCASRGNGATLNGDPLRVSRAPTLDQALVLTGFPYDRRKRSAFYLRFYQAFMVRTQGVRRSGSAALDLCYVACGRADGFWEWRLHPWDTAAGSLMVEEAGGKTNDFF